MITAAELPPLMAQGGGEGQDGKMGFQGYMIIYLSNNLNSIGSIAQLYM